MASLETHTSRTGFLRGLSVLGKRAFPVVVWALVAVGLFFYVGRTPRQTMADGVVECVDVIASPVDDGVVRDLMVTLLDWVEKGQVVAAMDDSLSTTELAAARAELTRLSAQLDAGKEELQHMVSLQGREDPADRRRFTVDEEGARLERLQMLATQESDAAELQRLALLLDRDKRMLAEGLISEEEYDNTRLWHKALERKISENEHALAAALDRQQMAEERSEGFQDAPPDVDLDRVLEPVRQEIAVQEARIAEVMERRKLLTLVAPCSGQVTAILKRPGETALSGDPVVSIRPEGALRAVVYFNERALPELEAGAKVRLQSKYRTQETTEGEVLRVSSQIQPLPERLLLNPQVPQYGIAAIISGLRDEVFLPGELIIATILPEAATERPSNVAGQMPQ